MYNIKPLYSMMDDGKHNTTKLKTPSVLIMVLHTFLCENIHTHHMNNYHLIVVKR